MNELILVVDDELKIVKLARDYLEQGGFRVIVAADGMSALAVARRERPDMIVLDLKLPGMDGLDVCRTLRRESEVPIIMLTARVEETDRLIGLELGADDYLTKPFSPRELVARVRAVLRRVQGGVRSPGLILAADLEIDLNGRRVTRQGEAITLTRSEFNLLVTLAQHPGRPSPASNYSLDSTMWLMTALPAASMRTSRTCARSWRATRASPAISSPSSASAINSATRWHREA